MTQGHLGDSLCDPAPPASITAPWTRLSRGQQGDREANRAHGSGSHYTAP